jgi:hypothetical protein
VLVALPHLLESFVDLSSSRGLSLTCRALNGVFSTNPKRFLSGKTSHGLCLASKHYFGAFEVWVPLRFAQLVPDRWFSRLFVSTLPNLFSFLFEPVTCHSALDVLACIRPLPKSEVCWRVVRNDSDRMVLEYPLGVNMLWQEFSFLRLLDAVDVCSASGVWCTCKVIEVTDKMVIVQLPWWFSSRSGGDLKCVTYPSAYLAKAGSQAYNWRAHLRHGSRLQLKVVGQSRLFWVTLCFPSASSMYNGYTATDGVHMFLLDGLEDTDSILLGPHAHGYTLSSEGFSISKLDLSDTTKRTRVSFYARYRYDVPRVTVYSLTSSTSSTSSSSSIKSASDPFESSSVSVSSSSPISSAGSAASSAESSVDARGGAVLSKAA